MLQLQIPYQTSDHLFGTLNHHHSSDNNFLLRIQHCEFFYVQDLLANAQRQRLLTLLLRRRPSLRIGIEHLRWIQSRRKLDHGSEQQFPVPGTLLNSIRSCRR